MARPPNPRIRARLRDHAIDYVLSHGVTDLALRPLAKALGTNARMLVYHFGSREGLIREIVTGVREREDVRIRAWFRSSNQARTLSEFLRWYWRRMSAPQARSALRLIFELYALALRDPGRYPGALSDPLSYWQAFAAEANVRDPHATEATLLLAITRGLLLDLCATNDRARVERALTLFAKLLRSLEKTSASTPARLL